MSSIGIMQGRLTESKGRGIQFFPFENWENEFYIAAQINISEIEWIFDYERYETNPCWTERGRKEICNIINKTGVRVRSICFDYFMRRPFYKYVGSERIEVYRENIRFINTLIEVSNAIGAELIEIPLVDNSSISNKEEFTLAIDFIKEILKYAKSFGISIGLETDFPPYVFRDFLERIDQKDIYANYDAGNSSGLGYNHRDELISLGDRLANVHIKDRVLGGSTVELGTGSANFEQVFESLKKIGYTGGFILQAARGNDGDEIATIKKQMEFVDYFLAKYSFDSKETK